MSIHYKILGKPGKDNGAFVSVNSGTRFYRLLFDCGEGILNIIEQSEVKSIDHIFFSHLHIDHVAGFDYFFRRNFNREKPVFIWGPEETSDIIQNRMLGYKWNLTEDLPGEFFINDITLNTVNTYKLFAAEGFREKHFVDSNTIFNDKIFSTIDFEIKAAFLDHGIPSIGYSLNEQPSININKNALAKAGLFPGSWLQKIKDTSINDDEIIKIDGDNYNILDLRKQLLVSSEGESFAYFTDFIFNTRSINNAIRIINNCDTLVCESQYVQDDFELAKINYHLTSEQAATLAKMANVKKLILFHISERYMHDSSKIDELLKEAIEVFPNTSIPESWYKQGKQISE